MSVPESKWASTASPAVTCVLVLTLLYACTASGPDARPGVYVLPSGSDAPRWIGGPAGAPVWSPDGRDLAWATEDGLMIASPASGETRALARQPIVGRPAWSPDGDAIAFVDEATASLVIAETTTGATRLTTTIATEAVAQNAQDLLVLGGPAWSPDGSRLAYVCWDGAGDELCVVDAARPGARTVTKLEPAPDASDATASSNAGPPAWSPDGATIAVAAYPERRGGAAGVFVIDLEQGTARRVSKLLPNSEIVWAADGGSIVFSALEKGRSDAWRVVVNSSQSTKLTADLPNGARDPVLSPDETELAVVSEGRVTVLNEALESRQIDTFGLKGTAPAWNPAGDGIALAAAPDPIQSYD